MAPTGGCCRRTRRSITALKRGIASILAGSSKLILLAWSVGEGTSGKRQETRRPHQGNINKSETCRPPRRYNRTKALVTSRRGRRAGPSMRPGSRASDGTSHRDRGITMTVVIRQRASTDLADFARQPDPIRTIVMAVAVGSARAREHVCAPLGSHVCELWHGKAHAHVDGRPGRLGGLRRGCRRAADLAGGPPPGASRLRRTCTGGARRSPVPAVVEGAAPPNRGTRERISPWRYCCHGGCVHHSHRIRTATYRNVVRWGNLVRRSNEYAYSLGMVGNVGGRL